MEEPRNIAARKAKQRVTKLPKTKIKVTIISKKGTLTYTEILKKLIPTSTPKRIWKYGKITEYVKP